MDRATRGHLTPALGIIGGHQVIRILVAVAMSVISFNLHATTWSNEKVPDPIDPNAQCNVQMPMSSGSYIYQWPEKYDQVFWPLTDEAGIGFCEGSGFTAFIGDFKNIGDDEKAAISKYLKENFHGVSSISEKLKLLQEIYNLRSKDDLFKNRLLRVLARWNQNLGNFEESAKFRRAALDGMVAGLGGELTPQKRLEYLYVCANYYKFFGQTEESNNSIAEIRRLSLELAEDEELKGYVTYLEKLIKDIERIKPGDKLDPVSTNDA